MVWVEEGGNLHQAAAALGGDWEFIAGSTSAVWFREFESENTGALGDDTCRVYWRTGLNGCDHDIWLL
jgi:hypothetical protein